MASSWRQLLLLLAWSICLSRLVLTPASADCVHGGLDGFPECSNAGVCTNSTISSHQYCFCNFGRFEMGGQPSWKTADAKCTLDLNAAAGDYTSAGYYMLGVVLSGTLLATLTCFTRVCCRRAGREARFERLLVMGTDVLKPTPVQLRFARFTIIVCIICLLWYLLDLFADPFNQNGTINKAGGFKYVLDETDGSSTMSGFRLRYLIEDVSEVLMFMLYCLFFVVYRKVCVPAPALLSGTRFQHDWHSSSSKQSLRAHKDFVRTAEERQREEKEREEEREREMREGDGDTQEDRDRRWREEESAALQEFS